MKVLSEHLDDDPKISPRQLTSVELFCGIGGFRLAADATGITTIWANDIDMKACKVYRSKFGSTLVEGDINLLLDSIPPHDILSGGFPCQPFSSAGKKLGTRDPRGTLFHAIVRVIAKHSPRFFVLENVKRLLSMEKGCHFATIVSALADLGYRIEWRLLNAVNFSLAQNRQRIVIIGSRLEAQGEGSYLAPPSDFSVITDAQVDVIHDKNRWFLIEKHEMKFPTWGVAESDRFIGYDLPYFSDASSTTKLVDILESGVAEQFDFTNVMESRLAVNDTVHRFVDGVEILSNQAGGARMGYTIFGIRGVAPTLTASTSRHYERYKIGDRFRRLTNIEYARLQGFPDEHCSAVSIYDQYALLGNAVPPPLVKWVFNRIRKGSTPIPSSTTKQLPLFTAPGST